VRPPQGVGKENRLALVRQGRVAADLETPIRDWRAAKVYKTNLRVRDDLAQMGAPLERTRIDQKTEVLVNPKGRVIPPGWKLPEELADGGFNPEEIEREARRLVDGFFAETPEQVAAMQKAARAAGVHPELRVVRKDIAERYFAQFMPGRRGGSVLSTYDRLVDLTAASIIFARVGYLPKQWVQNIVMVLPHQGAYVLPQRRPRRSGAARLQCGRDGTHL
jgi:hypothetical protein